MSDDDEAIEENTDESESVKNQAAPPVKKGPEILYKSSKDFYRAMAKQWGITCKMSDNCRCLDCQVTETHSSYLFRLLYNIFDESAQKFNSKLFQ
jgi:hypothetical protein